MRGLKPLARAFLTRFPGSRRLLHRTTAVQAVRGQFSVAGARQSFELSLRSLGVDYIDILFLHSPTLADITADLIEFLDDLIRQGKLRAYGVASSARTATAVRTAWPPITIAQFPGGLRHAVCNLASPITGPTITHGVFEGAATLLARVRSNGPDLSRLGLAGINESQLHQLLLGYALGANHSGPIICSMLGEGRVRENVATIEHPNFSRDQYLQIRRLGGTIGLDRTASRIRANMSERTKMYAASSASWLLAASHPRRAAEADA